MRTNSGEKTLVTGANGILGTQLLRLLTPARAIAATRRADFADGSFAHVQIETPEAVDRAPFDRVDAVINAAGAASGPGDALSAANVAYPVALARAARAAGVRRFVQVSSFAVYGAADSIGPSTPEHPIAAYGKSKVDGDRALLALATDRFSVACVRIPFLFGPDQPALIGQLLDIGRRLPFLPCRLDAKRSMLTYANAARMLLDVARKTEAGVSHAADPQAFDFELLNRLIVESGGRRLRIIGLPAATSGFVAFAAPTIHRRLFQSNLLNPQANIAGTPCAGESIEDAIRAIVRTQTGLRTR